MDEFIWIEWNIQKVANHSLSPDEVEFAWRNGTVDRDDVHPVNGQRALLRKRGPVPFRPADSDRVAV